MMKKEFNKEKFLKNQAKKMKWEFKILARKHGVSKARSLMEERYGWRGKLAALSLDNDNKAA